MMCRHSEALLWTDFLSGRAGERLKLGARPSDRTATQRSKKGSETVLGRVLGKDSQKGSEKGAFLHGFCSKQGF